MIYDLHCHTTASDGSLTPRELIARAAEKGVTHLAITDHDTVAAYQKIDRDDCPLTLIPGIEFSTQWRKTGIHIVGLNIDLHSNAVAEGTKYQSAARRARAENIAEKLRARGLDCEFTDIQKLAGGGQIGRPHFAQHLVNTDAVKTVQQAFKKYLGAGKPGDIKQHWADLSQIIEWIRGAGGTAVLAHPDKYKLTRTKLIALIDDFKTSGGKAIEVISGKQIPSLTRQLATLCDQHQLLASCGSDFHQPGQPWAELGEHSELPECCIPVWTSF